MNLRPHTHVESFKSIPGTVISHPPDVPECTLIYDIFKDLHNKAPGGSTSSLYWDPAAALPVVTPPMVRPSPFTDESRVKGDDERGEIYREAAVVEFEVCVCVSVH